MTAWIARKMMKRTKGRRAKRGRLKIKNLLLSNLKVWNSIPKARTKEK